MKPIQFLIETHPHLLEEWDYEANRSVTPEQVGKGSRKKVWWKCRFNHRWEASLNNRAGKNQACPYCSGKRADASTTSLLAKHPELCQEWDDSRNPADFLPNSHKKVWWKCRVDSTHRWEASPNNRVANHSVCPHCKESGGEALIRKALVEIGVAFSVQYRFADCKSRRSLPFDFAIHEPCLAMIEFHGGQHFKAFEMYGGEKGFVKQVQRDKIKKEYCLSRGIPFLEIPEGQRNQIPVLVKRFIDSLRGTSGSQ